MKLFVDAKTNWILAKHKIVRLKHDVAMLKVNTFQKKDSKDQDKVGTPHLCANVICFCAKCVTFLFEIRAYCILTY